MKALILMAALLLAGSAAYAQVPTNDPPSAVLQSCLLGTPIEVWNSLKLSSDQMKRMIMVQEACKEECDLAGIKKQPNPISNADGSTIMSEVTNILNNTQYSAWVAYCQGLGEQPQR